MDSSFKNNHLSKSDPLEILFRLAQLSDTTIFKPLAKTELFNESSLALESALFHMDIHHLSSTSKPRIESVPQIQRSKVGGFISGISTTLARFLLRADVCHLSRAYEILADLGHLGTVMTRNDFISTLSQYMSEGAARSAFDILSGKTAHRHATDKKYKRSKHGYREKLSEFMVKIVYSNKNSNVIQGTNFTKNSNTSKRGRKGEGRPDKELYVPTEGEMVQILLIISIPGISKELDWASSDPKPIAVLTNQTKYKAFIMSTTVFEEGKGDYSRKRLAAQIGIHENSVRKYAEIMGITVTTHEPNLKRISEKNIISLPKDEEERDRWILRGDKPKGVHIQTSLKKQFAYTQAGALAAIAHSKGQGGSGEIFEARYVASTYDPETSEHYIGW